MELRFERTIAASPQRVWCEVCEPERMSRWSLARIESRELGQGGHPGGPGALRRVHLRAAGQDVVLSEVIRDAEVGKLLIYQVIDNTVVRNHRGTIRLSEQDGKTLLSWSVVFSCTAPGMASLIARQLKKQLGVSLDRLKQQVEDAPQEPIRTPSFGPVPSAPVEVWTKAERVHTALTAHATQLASEDDPKRIFAQVYSLVSEGILEACHRGDFVYPNWPLRLLPVFHDYYQRNYERWCSPDASRVERHWRLAFEAFEGTSGHHTTEAERLIGGLILAVRAHIESDLPRSLAEVYVDHFSKHSDYARFRGDYITMGPIFQTAFARVWEVIPERCLPTWTRVAGRALPASVVQELSLKRAYDLPAKRQRAFRRGAELADMLLRRSQLA